MKSHTYTKYLCILLFTFFFCDKESNPLGQNGLKKDVLVPLDICNRWTYETCYYGGGEPIEESIAYLLVRIVDNMSIEYEGQEFNVAAWTTNSSSHIRWLQWNGEDGHFAFGGMSDEDTLIWKYLEYKYPVEVGESWHVPWISCSRKEHHFYFEDTLAYECISFDHEFKTPLGTYNCIVYHYQIKLADDVAKPRDVYDYFMPGIGFIGRTYGRQERPYHTQLLYSYYIR